MFTRKFYYFFKKCVKNKTKKLRNWSNENISNETKSVKIKGMKIEAFDLKQTPWKKVALIIILHISL